ncbi:hypothetical protein Tco_0860731 [Tanacetum coccineum]|uniref:Uncharacterized protein n=1 Tax=Tanacetum coccineum TaxID=301880 RepID=A0ABQ5BLG5_9ASTR
MNNLRFRKRNRLKALDEGFSSKNYVRKFLRALHPKWRAKGLFVLCMERGFLSQKESGGGRGVKEKKQGDGGAHSLGNGGTLSGTGAAQSSNTVDDIGKDNDGLSLSPTKELEDSDAKESFVANSQPKPGDVGCFSDTRKRKRVVLDDSE